MTIDISQVLATFGNGDAQDDLTDLLTEARKHAAASGLDYRLSDQRAEGHAAFEVPEQPRVYAVGLPVIITVHPGGRVTYNVDLSEASDIFDTFMPEDDDDENQAEQDAVTIDRAVTAGTIAHNSQEA